MIIIVNGNSKEYQDNITLIELIDDLNLKNKVMALAVNGTIVKKDTWNSYNLQHGDKVELLHFVGGG